MNSTYDKNILEICSNINDQIIDAYKMYKTNDFYRAMRINKYSDTIKEFFMKKGVFIYKLVDERWQSVDIEYVIACINENGAIPRVQNSIEPLMGKRYILEIDLKIYEKRDKIIEKIATDKNHATTIDKFFSYYAKNYLKEKKFIEEKLKVLADLPNDIKKAYEEFKNPPNILNKLESEISAKLDSYSKSVDIMEIYKLNPRMFIEKLKGMEQNKREVIVKQLLRLDMKQANTELDKMIENEFPGLIAGTFRKNA